MERKIGFDVWSIVQCLLLCACAALRFPEEKANQKVAWNCDQETYHLAPPLGKETRLRFVVLSCIAYVRLPQLGNVV